MLLKYFEGKGMTTPRHKVKPFGKDSIKNTLPQPEASASQQVEPPAVAVPSPVPTRPRNKAAPVATREPSDVKGKAKAVERKSSDSDPLSLTRMSQLPRNAENILTLNKSLEGNGRCELAEQSTRNIQEAQRLRLSSRMSISKTKPK